MENAELTKYSEIKNRIFKNEEILFSVISDVNEKGDFEDRGLFVSETKLALLREDRAEIILNIRDIEKICCGELVGGGAIEAFVSGERMIVARFSMKYMERFFALSEVVNELCEGRILRIDEDSFSSEVCPVCKNPYIKDTKICRHCTSKLSVAKRLWELSKPCRGLYVILMCLFLIGSAVTIFTPFLNRTLVNEVLVSVSASRKTLIIIVSLMVLASIITMLEGIFKSMVSSKASNLLVRDLRNEIFGKLQKMPLSYIEEKKTGDLMQRINSDTQRIQVFIQDIAIMAVNEIILFAAMAFVTFSINKVMSLLIFVPMPFCFIAIYKIRTGIQRRYRKQWGIMDKLTNRLTDCINGIKVVKVFGREKDEVSRFQKTAGMVRDLTCKNEKYVYTIFPLIKFIMSFGGYFVLLYGGSKVIGHEMSIGELVQFSSYGGYLYSKLEWFSMLPRHVTMAVASSQRIFEVLDENDEFTGKNDKSTENLKGDFSFRNVSFGYKSYRPVLKNINTDVQKGEMIGLVGHSGAGKSTLINLVMRLYNPDRGEILLDGAKLSDYNKSEYKSTLGIVLQENYLFSGSILQNISYACENATYEDIIKAAKRANAHDFIMNLPDGYDTYVGEKGYRLSGGERQRISIARAIASNPDIVILDEATASVDTETEEKIQDALSNITEGKTVFAIAHRLSTLRNADRLIVIEEGKIAETGSHEELYRKKGIYYSLLKAQREMALATKTIDNTEIADEDKTINSVEGEEEYGEN